MERVAGSNLYMLLFLEFVLFFAAVSNQEIWAKKSRVPSNPETFFTKTRCASKLRNRAPRPVLKIAKDEVRHGRPVADSFLVEELLRRTPQAAQQGCLNAQHPPLASTLFPNSQITNNVTNKKPRDLLFLGRANFERTHNATNR